MFELPEVAQPDHLVRPTQLFSDISGCWLLNTTFLQSCVKLILVLYSKVLDELILITVGSAHLLSMNETFPRTPGTLIWSFFYLWKFDPPELPELAFSVVPH